MSLEKRREPRKTKKEQELEESSFRNVNFKPLKERVMESDSDIQELLKQKEDLEKELKVKKENFLSSTEENEHVVVKTGDIDAKKDITIQKLEDIELSGELTEIEVDVLKIAKGILKLKRYKAEFEELESEVQIQKYPIIEKLYAKCIGKLSFNKGYSKGEIFKAIRSLEDKNWIVTNERRTKLEIFENKKFADIIRFLAKNPGIHARDEKVEKEIGITRTPFLKYIMTLERFKIIRSRKIGKTLHYFLIDVPNDYDQYKVIFLNPLIPKIIKEIFKDNTISIKNIGDILDVYSGTIQYHTKKLIDLNLIKSAKNQAGKKIYLVNIELLKLYNDFFKEPDFSLLLRGI